MTFRFGNDKTLETRTLAVLPVGIAGVNGVLRLHVVHASAPLFFFKGIPEDLGCHIDQRRGHLFFEKLGVRAVVTAPTLALDELWSTRDTRSRLKFSHTSALMNVQSTVSHVTVRV